MKKYRSTKEIVGLASLIASSLAFLVFMIMCYAEIMIAIPLLFLAFAAIIISYKVYISGKRKSDRHLGSDNKDDADDNIYKNSNIEL